MFHRDEEVPQGLPKQISGPKRKRKKNSTQDDKQAAEAKAALVAEFITPTCSRPTLTRTQFSKLER